MRGLKRRTLINQKIALASRAVFLNQCQRYLYKYSINDVQDHCSGNSCSHTHGNDEADDGCASSRHSTSGSMNNGGTEVN